MLNGSAAFFNCKESVSFRYYSHLRDTKYVIYISKFIISAFVITVRFCKEWSRILPGTKNTHFLL